MILPQSSAGLKRNLKPSQCLTLTTGKTVKVTKAIKGIEVNGGNAGKKGVFLRCQISNGNAPALGYFDPLISCMLLQLTTRGSSPG